jgi:hypothetical protein
MDSQPFEMSWRDLAKTPEFANKFVYKYLACWSCGSESPFMWDGNEGGLAGSFAPLPGFFHAFNGELPPDLRTSQRSRLP